VSGLSKLRDVMTLDAALARSSSLSPTERVSFWARRYVTVARRRNEIEYLGHPFRYDNPFTPIILGAYPQEAERLVALLGSAPRTVLDIGANVGQFAVSIAHLAPGARGWSFEPNPGIVPLLEANTAHLPSWRVVPTAVGARSEERDFWSVPDKSSQGSFVRENSESGIAATAVPTRVRTVTLDGPARAELDIPAEIDLVKIDVEGAESDAIRGIAGLEWRWMAVEVSTDEREGLSLEGTVDLIRSLWDRVPEVRWAPVPAPGTIARDVVLRLPDAP
jgi:FkbM family methyltransferase